MSFTGLADVHTRTPGYPSYGDMGELALGACGRYTVQAALSAAQLEAEL